MIQNLIRNIIELLAMTRKSKIYFKCIGLYLYLISIPINAQILQDTTSLNLVKKNIDYIYNL